MFCSTTIQTRWARLLQRDLLCWLRVCGDRISWLPAIGAFGQNAQPPASHPALGFYPHFQRTCQATVSCSIQSLPIRRLPPPNLKAKHHILRLLTTNILVVV